MVILYEFWTVDGDSILEMNETWLKSQPSFWCASTAHVSHPKPSKQTCKHHIKIVSQK